MSDLAMTERKWENDEDEVERREEHAPDGALSNFVDYDRLLVEIMEIMDEIGDDDGDSSVSIESEDSYD